MDSLLEALKRPRNVLLALVAVTVLAHANTLQNGFVYDDFELIVDNPRIGDWSHVPELFRKGWRPLKRLSLMVDHALWGLRPVGYHATNVAWHLLATIGVWWLALSLGARSRVAALAGLLFAVHPIHVEAVAVITHRKEMMATAFLLAALIAHVRLPSGPRRVVLVLGCFAGSLLSKEIVGAAFPPLLILVDLSTRSGSIRQRLRSSVPVLAPVVLGLLGLLAVRMSYLGEASLLPFFDREHLLRTSNGALDTYPPILGSALRGTWRYLVLLAIPVTLSAEPAFDLSTRLFEPAVAAAALGLVAYGVCVVVLLRRGKSGLLALGLAWTLLALLPATNIIPLTSWFLADRFLYLPSVGACLALAVGLDALGRFRPLGSRGPAIALALSLALTALFTVKTIAQNRTWKDNRSFLAQALKANPGSYMARVGLAGEAWREGDPARAIELYRECLTIRPDDLRALQFMTEAARDAGRPQEALALAHRALELRPDEGALHVALGNCLLDLGRRDEAFASYQRAVAADPRLAAARVNLCDSLIHFRRVPEATEHCEEALRLDPGNADAHYLLGLACDRLGDAEGARFHLKRALAIQPTYPRRDYALGVLRRLGPGPERRPGADGSQRK